jgi:hypothetical protein
MNGQTSWLSFAANGARPKMSSGKPYPSIVSGRSGDASTSAWPTKSFGSTGSLNLNISPEVLLRSNCGQRSLARLVVKQADDDVQHDRTSLFAIVMVEHLCFRPASSVRENGFVGSPPIGATPGTACWRQLLIPLKLPLATMRLFANRRKPLPAIGHGFEHCDTGSISHASQQARKAK